MAIGSPQWMYNSGADAYELEQSLKFNDDDSAYLSRTPASAGNRKTWTISLWFKRANLTNDQTIFQAGTTGGNRANIYLANNTIQFLDTTSTDVLFTSSQLLRDVSSWYHLVVQFDTTQGTASDRLKMYLNGTRITAFADSNTIAQNTDGLVNSTIAHAFGTPAYNSAIAQFDGYLAEINFIDGQALTSADFGETGDYGEWKPIEYSGTYGTNGFYLNFAGGGIMSATGGNSTATDGDFKAASFTSNGTFTPSANGYVEYLVIAGGGGGGQSHGAGGGGAGGYRTGYLPVTGGTGYSITVGAGGGNNGNGANSVFSTITSIGGGAGAYGTNENETGGTDGGSGGGGGAQTLDLSAGAGTTGQGNNGAAAINGSYWQGGGGGGAGAAGASGVGSTGGIGGAGLASSITGSSVTRAGGGGGGHHGGLGGSNGTGGSGGGGTAGDGTTSGSGTGRAGTANTGSGGGGSSGANLGGSGGSGIVIIRYKFQ
jgi:hypothetical protein|tara:strand:- start:5 stop:1462 length:1458 start_codon:yes stop_codon:yes gene_type:complete